MPTMILTLAWLLTATTHLATAPAVDLASNPSVAPVVNPADQPHWLGVLADPIGDEANWLFEAESDDDETDPAAPPTTWDWPAARSPFGVTASNPHPTIVPRSALRSPVLRC